MWVVLADGLNSRPLPIARHMFLQFNYDYRRGAVRLDRRKVESMACGGDASGECVPGQTVRSDGMETPGRIALGIAHPGEQDAPPPAEMRMEIPGRNRPSIGVGIVEDILADLPAPKKSQLFPAVED